MRTVDDNGSFDRNVFEKELLFFNYQQLGGVAFVRLRSLGGAVTYDVCIRIS